MIIFKQYSKGNYIIEVKDESERLITTQKVIKQ
jgi:hypothetical protein